MKRALIPAALALCLFACSGGDGDSLLALDVAAGLESQDGVEAMPSASELAVYPGPAGGHLAFVWVGGEVPGECLNSAAGGDCRAHLSVTLADGVLLDQVYPVTEVESPVDNWLLRVIVPLDFSRLGYQGLDAPLGDVAEVQFSLRVGDASTELSSARVTLVEGRFNPDAR